MHFMKYSTLMSFSFVPVNLKLTYEWQECDDFLERMKRIRITPILQNSAMVVRLLLTNYVRVHTLSMYAASGEGVYHAK